VARASFVFVEERHDRDEEVVAQRLLDEIHGVIDVHASSWGVTVDYVPDQVTPR